MARDRANALDARRRLVHFLALHDADQGCFHRSHARRAPIPACTFGAPRSTTEIAASRVCATTGFNFSNAITFGRAGYVATGRGFQMDTVKLIELYARYAESHIHYGFELLLYLVLFLLITKQPSDEVWLYVWPVALLVVGLVLSPWIFNPGALTFTAVTTAWIIFVLQTSRRGGCGFFLFFRNSSSTDPKSLLMPAPPLQKAQPAHTTER